MSLSIFWSRIAVLFAARLLKRRHFVRVLEEEYLYHLQIFASSDLNAVVVLLSRLAEILLPSSISLSLQAAYEALFSWLISQNQCQLCLMQLYIIRSIQTFLRYSL